MVSVRILELLPTERWHSRTAELDSPSPKSLPYTSYVFISVKAFPAQEAERRDFLHYFNVPPLLASDVCNKGNGHFGCEEISNNRGQLQAYSKYINGLIALRGALMFDSCTWFRCLVKDVKGTNDGPPIYVWYEMTFFTRWEQNHSIFLCIDAPDNTQSMLEIALSRNFSTLNLMDPFSMYIPLIDHIITVYDRSVWGIRDLVRPIEKAREENQEIEPNFQTLHEISRHAIHCSEVLTVTTSTMSLLMEEHKYICTRIHQGAQIATSFENTQKRLRFQTQFISNLKLRSEANYQRLQGEITLAYNVIIQRDSKIMVVMGKAATSDSAAMKTVAFITMTFLPATFVSAIFSMSFFDFSPGDDNQPDVWKMSDKIWIYWLTAMPLTLLTLGAWALWHYGESLGTRDLILRMMRFRRLPAGEAEKYA